MKSIEQLRAELRLNYISEPASTISDEKADNALTRAIQRYSTIAMQSSGAWQSGDLSSATSQVEDTTLATGESQLRLDPSFLYVERFDIATDEKTYTLTASNEAFHNLQTTRPQHHDLRGDVVYFDAIADQDYTVTIYYQGTIPFGGQPDIHEEYILTRAAYTLSFPSSDEARNSLREEVVMMEKEIDRWYSERQPIIQMVVNVRMVR